jgi:hypothetical protein
MSRLHEKTGRTMIFRTDTLLAGDEPTGLRWLHGAQQGFEASGQREELMQCLENEAAYLDHAKKKDIAEKIRARLESLAAG